jgi:hypothetical protein
MTFIEEIYTELTKRTPINTDNFSTDWLGQSRSYYTSIKSRHMEASSQSLVHLMNKLSYSPIFGQISGVFKLLPAPADRFHCC